MGIRTIGLPAVLGGAGLTVGAGVFVGRSLASHRRSGPSQRGVGIEGCCLAPVRSA